MSDAIPWDDLRLFLAILRAGTLTATAKLEGLSQPTLGRRLQQLEARVGQPLLRRSEGRFIATEAGRTLAASATRMEAEAYALDRLLFAGGEALSGLLRLSSSEWFARHVLTPKLVGFRELNPGVVIEVVAETRLLDLDRREADIVFRFRHFEEPFIVQRHFAHIVYGAFASFEVARLLRSDGRDAPRSPISLIVMDTAQAGLADVEWLQARLPAAEIGLRSNSRDIQAEACAGGGGVAVLPLTLGDSYGLELIDLGEPPPTRDVWLGYHGDLRDHPPTRALIQHLTR